mmetsp:Transcript_37568/g.121432  ORF Transcript_37568/g.121432 Transcript_37568/m.121432 type:complete len:227 (-) Transcript_37568:774-1454(-)
MICAKFGARMATSTAAASRSGVSASSSASSSAIASRHILRANWYASGWMRIPSSPGGCRGSPGSRGGSNLRKPTAFAHTHGPSNSRSPSRVLTSCFPPCARRASSSRRSAAALRGPRPGTNWRAAPRCGCVSASLTETPRWQVASTISAVRAAHSSGSGTSPTSGERGSCVSSSPVGDTMWQTDSNGSCTCLASASAMHCVGDRSGSSARAAGLTAHMRGSVSSAK